MTDKVETAILLGMSKAKEQTVLLGLGLFAAGLWLLSNPNCDRGCKTVAEHLLGHGIEDFFKGFAL